MNEPDSDINSEPLYYWRLNGYTDADLDNYCRENDAEFMFAKIEFIPDEHPVVTVSTRTWQLQQGHYGAIVRFFRGLAKTETGKTLSGSVLIYLEDGIFDYTRHRTRRVPFVGFGRTYDDFAAFLMPDPAFLYSDGYFKEFTQIVQEENALTEPKLNRIFWRGAASGTSFHDENWRISARAQLVVQAKAIGDLSIVDARLTKLDHLPESQQEMFKEMELTAPYTDFYEFLKYKYLIDVDGYHCAWKSLFLKLMSRSVVLKVQSPLEQWYYRKLKAWQHYVPLRGDSSDIREAYEWLESHPAECQKISRDANLLVDSITIQSETEYMARLFEKILSFKRGASGSPGAR